MDNNTMTVVALIVAAVAALMMVILVVKKVIRTDTVEQIADAVRNMPETIGSGLFARIYEYSRAAVLAVEQLVKNGQIQRDDQTRKETAMRFVEQAALVDDVPFGAGENEMASICIEAAVQQLPRNQA